MTGPPAVIDERLATVLTEVQEAVKRHSVNWQQLQNRILGRVREYQKVATLRSAIYSIYSREERQWGMPDPHLKAPQKIAAEIVLNRFGGTKQRSGKIRTIAAQPNFTIYDISDVIGITIVCPFDADVSRVIDQIEADCGLGHFSALGEPKRHDRRDYQAAHISLKVADRNLQELQCEVQVKTAVQDAFSWKTHGLAYKSEEDADPWFIEQFVRISVLLRTADGISDQLRGRLEQERNVSIKKRQTVRAALLLVFREHLDKIEDERETRDLEKIAERLRKASTLTHGPERAALLQDLRGDIEKAFTDYGYSANTFRLAVLYATAPEDNGYLARADRHYQTWIVEGLPADPEGSRVKFEEWTRCANLLAIAHYCSNDMSSAIQIAEGAVRRAGARESEEVGQLHVNLAYYYAEQANDTSSADDRAKAAAHAEKARKMLGKKIAPSDRDSLGFVQISTGDTIEEVEAGLAECKAAFKQGRARDAPDKLRDLAKTFFEIHRELAYKRLSQLVSSRG